jgi:membrane-bound serine protease (ClpP class)
MSTLAVVGLLMVFGIVFLAIEFFIVPGFSVPGLAGITLIGYAAYRAYVSFNLTGAFASLLVSIIATIILLKLAFKTRALRAFTLEHTQRGGTAADDFRTLLGKTGSALTDLRPAGTAVIEGERRDVVTDGEYIDEQEPIIVTAVEGSRIVVTSQERR